MQLIKKCFIPMILVVLVMTSSASADDGLVDLFAYTYVRTAGEPATWTEQIEVPESIVAPYSIRVENGLDDGSLRVSSATVDLNGERVVRPRDLNQNVAVFECDVDLQTGTNTLQVRLTSQPDGRLAITLMGTPSAVGDPPQPPPWMMVTAGESDSGAGVAIVGWEPSPSQDVVEYRVYRGSSRDQLALVATIPASDSVDGAYEYNDDYDFGTVVFFAVAATGYGGIEGPRTEPRATCLVDPGQLRFPELSSKLNALFELTDAGADLVDSAEDLGLSVSVEPAPQVAVVVSLTLTPTAADLDRLQQEGLTIGYHSGTVVLGSALIDRLPDLCGLPMVYWVRPQPMAYENSTESDQGSGKIKEIKQLLGITAAHEQGIKGEGVTVAVIDQGGHSTRVRKIIRKAAPDCTIAELAPGEYPYFGLMMKLDEAVDEPDYRVVNISAGFGPDLHLASFVEDRFRKNPDVLGVISAGNEAQSHHSTNMGSPIEAQLEGTAGEPFTLYLYSPVACWVDGKPAGLRGRVCPLPRGVCRPLQPDEGEIEVSTHARIWLNRNQDSARVYVDQFPGECSDRYGNPVPKNQIPIHMVTLNEDENVRFSNPTPYGSITGIAAAPSVLTIGASVRTKPPTFPDSVADYSCRGPAVLPDIFVKDLSTVPNIWGFPALGTEVPKKPEIVAPGRFKTFLLGDNTGTSFAAPWVSGAAALLMQFRRCYYPAAAGTPEEIAAARAAMIENAVKFDPSLDYGRLEIVADHGAVATQDQWIYWVSSSRGNYRRLDTGTYVHGIATEPGTDTVWYIDGRNIRVVRVSEAGTSIYNPPAGTDYVESITCKTKDGTCWISTIDGGLGEDTFARSKLIHLRFDVGTDTIQKVEDIDVTIDIETLRIDPRTGTLWGCAWLSRLQRQQHGVTGGIWKQGVSDRLGIVYPSHYCRSLAIDPGPEPDEPYEERFVWTHGRPTGEDFHAIVKLKLDGTPDATLGGWYDSLTYDFAVDPESRELIATHYYGWTRYDQDLNVESHVPYTGGGEAHCGRISAVDGSLWGLSFDRYDPNVLFNFDSQGNLLHSTPLPEGWQARLELFVKLPESPSAPSP